MYYAKAFAMCGASLVASVAVAGTPADLIVVAKPQNLVERRIPYADLNLAAASAERTLERRIGRAVGSLCDEAVADDRTTLEYRECERQAWRGARPQMLLAVQRAHEVAAAGTSRIDATSVTIALPK